MPGMGNPWEHTRDCFDCSKINAMFKIIIINPSSRIGVHVVKAALAFSRHRISSAVELLRLLWFPVFRR